MVPGIYVTFSCFKLFIDIFILIYLARARMMTRAPKAMRMR